MHIVIWCGWALTILLTLHSVYLRGRLDLWDHNDRVDQWERDVHQAIDTHQPVPAYPKVRMNKGKYVLTIAPLLIMAFFTFPWSSL